MTRAKQRLTRDAVIKAAGALDDVSIAEIIATGATIEELEEAVTWANGVTRLGRELGRPLTGVVAQLYEILTADEAFADDRS